MNLTMEPQVLMSIIAIVAGVTIYSFVNSRHLERMEQLQMGISLDKFKKRHLELKFGLLFIGVGLGILVAFILSRLFSNANQLYPAFIFLFGGIGLVISFVLVQRDNSSDDF